MDVCAELPSHFLPQESNTACLHARLQMRKIWVEVCMISARGLPSSLLWKLQWFAVGWIDPKNKFCTKIDAPGNANPVWKTKFSGVVDTSDSNLEDLALHVEVYSREPVFLREKLHGTATIILKEFLAKYANSERVSNQGDEDVGSFQLRRKNSNKPRGFIDVSIRISEEIEGTGSHLGYEEEGFKLKDNSNSFSLATEANLEQTSKQGLSSMPYHPPGNPPQINYPYTQPTSSPLNYSNPSSGAPNPLSAGGQSSAPPRTPPPPPPPSNVGYIPTFLPRTNNLAAATYMNMPSAAGDRSGGPGFAAGLGVGALAAGSVIFGDDFLSGFDLPVGLQDASFTVSTDPPF
ncbi:hypothetical protein Nepgr_021200 [Nepenthes gracilis]|uniref:C2 domain-containing protein n=1 Tax=Nepenthes gracilis TaxID=150966 RepID=A0AAD3SY97_NEPGR|nr:hypothetical protein Nepgr_021200 [Nepenthes gracilis]